MSIFRRKTAEKSSSTRATTAPKPKAAPKPKSTTTTAPKPKTAPKPRSKDAKKGLSTFRIVVGLILFAISLYLMTALISHLFHWQSDQIYSKWDELSTLEEVANEAQLNAEKSPEGITKEYGVQNLCGEYGAFFANTIIGKWFGLAGLLLPIPILAISLLIMNISARMMFKLTISTMFGMLIVPATITLLTPLSDPTTLGGGYGGGYGNYIYTILRSTIGIAGTLITLLFCASVWLIYTFPYSFRWYVALSRILKNSAQAVGDKINDNSVPQQKAKTRTEKKPLMINQDNDQQEANTQSAEDEQQEATEDNEPIDISDFIEEQQAKEESLESIQIDDSDITFEVNSTEESPTETATEDSITPEIVSDDTLEHDQENRPQNEQNRENIDIRVSITDNAVIKNPEQLDNTNIEVNEQVLIDDEEFEQSIFDPTKELSRFMLPPLTLLNSVESKVNVTPEELQENTNRIVETLKNFGIKIQGIKATIGPTVTLYEIKPAPGVRISTIKRLEDDIALSLSALGIRIIAPIPGKDAVGIEVPNKNKEIVSMHSVIASADFQNSDAELPIVLGKTIQNKPYVVDLAKMPHLLVAGATGQGKSVGLNAIITSLLYKKHPAELKFVMVDPKKVEFSLYSSLERHYLAKLPDEDEPIIIDTQKVIYTLNSLCLEMDNRYELLKTAKVRNIKEYNNKFKERRLNPNKGHRFLPYFVVVIDEFGDLILTAGKEIETPLTRLAALARAVGIHLVIATQRPTTNIITGSIKANFPARMAFRVISGIDSKTILDSTGASQLIGKGDMLILANNDTTRVQCAFIDTPEVEKITEFIYKQVGFGGAYSLPEFVAEVKDGDSGDSRGTTIVRDALFDKVARYVVSNQQGSASTIQRNFEIGFNRAGRIMDQLEKAGVVGKQQGSKPRQVLIGDLTSLELHLIDLDRYE